MPNKIAKKVKELDELRDREIQLKQQIEKREINLEQQELLRQSIENHKAIKRTQSTLNRLDNPPPSRKSRPSYLGHSHIVASVCFSRLNVVGVTVIDTRSQTVLEYRNLRTLLTDQRSEVLEQRAAKIKGRHRRIIVKHSAEHPAKFKARKNMKVREKYHRSVLQLSLEQYRLVNRWRKERRKNLTERSEEQRRGLYAERDKESNQAQYLSRLIAR